MHMYICICYEYLRTIAELTVKKLSLSLTCSREIDLTSI